MHRSRTSILLAALLGACLVLAAVFASAPSHALEKRHRQGNASPVIANVEVLYDACMNRCRTSSVYDMALESCEKTCAELRRNFPLLDKGYKNHERCARDMDNFDLNRDILQAKAERWCFTTWLHVHKRQGCREGTEAFYAAADIGAVCGGYTRAPAGTVTPLAAPPGSVSASRGGLAPEVGGTPKYQAPGGGAEVRRHTLTNAVPTSGVTIARPKTAAKPSMAPAKAVAKTPPKAKAIGKAPGKTSVKAPVKTSAKTATKTRVKTPAKTATKAKASAKTATRANAKTPTRTPAKAIGKTPAATSGGMARTTAPTPVTPAPQPIPAPPAPTTPSVPKTAPPALPKAPTQAGEAPPAVQLPVVTAPAAPAPVVPATPVFITPSPEAANQALPVLPPPSATVPTHETPSAIAPGVSVPSPPAPQPAETPRSTPLRTNTMLPAESAPSSEQSSRTPGAATATETSPGPPSSMPPPPSMLKRSEHVPTVLRPMSN